MTWAPVGSHCSKANGHSPFDFILKGRPAIGLGAGPSRSPAGEAQEARSDSVGSTGDSLSFLLTICCTCCNRKFAPKITKVCTFYGFAGAEPT